MAGQESRQRHRTEAGMQNNGNNNSDGCAWIADVELC